MEHGTWTRLSGTVAGTTTLISARPGKLEGVALPANAAGTVEFYDSASGTAAASQFYVLKQTLAGTSPAILPLSMDLRFGLIAVTTGTYDCTVIYN